jgi:hypothetical protein
MRVPVLAMAAGVMLSASGCAAADVVLAPQPGSLVRTAEASYVIPLGANNFTITATVINNTGGALLLDGIGRDFFVLEKLVNGSWETVYHPVYTMQWVEPIRLEPGASRQVSIWLHLAPGAEPLLEDPNGTFRAGFGFGRDTEPHRIAAYTNEFQLQRADS